MRDSAIGQINEEFDTLLLKGNNDSITVGLFDKKDKNVSEPRLTVDYAIGETGPCFVYHDKNMSRRSVENFLDPLFGPNKRSRFVSISGERGWERAHSFTSGVLLFPFTSNERYDDQRRVEYVLRDLHLFVRMAPEFYYERNVTPPDFIARDSQAARAAYYVKQRLFISDLDEWVEDLLLQVPGCRLYNREHELSGSDIHSIKLEFKCFDHSAVRVCIQCYSTQRRLEGRVVSFDIENPARAYVDRITTEFNASADDFLDANPLRRMPSYKSQWVEARYARGQYLEGNWGQGRVYEHNNDPRSKPDPKPKFKFKS